jgi:hypothetical protein
VPGLLQSRIATLSFSPLKRASEHDAGNIIAFIDETVLLQMNMGEDALCISYIHEQWISPHLPVE